MVGTATVTAAAMVLSASLATGILSEERSPQGQVSFHRAISHSANNVIVSVVKGPQAITAKGSWREWMFDTVLTFCAKGRPERRICSSERPEGILGVGA